MSAPKFYWEVSPSKHGRGFVGMVYHEDRAGKWIAAFFRDDSREMVESLCKLQAELLLMSGRPYPFESGRSTPKYEPMPMEIRTPAEARW